jgi:hypothetical protein
MQIVLFKKILRKDAARYSFRIACFGEENVEYCYKKFKVKHYYVIYLEIKLNPTDKRLKHEENIAAAC